MGMSDEQGSEKGNPDNGKNRGYRSDEGVGKFFRERVKMTLPNRKREIFFYFCRKECDEYETIFEMSVWRDRKRMVAHGLVGPIGTDRSVDVRRCHRQSANGCGPSVATLWVRSHVFCV